MLILLICAETAIFLGEGLPLIRKKRWKDLAVIVVLLAVTFALWAGKAVGLEPPVKWLGGWLQEYGEKLFG